MRVIQEFKAEIGDLSSGVVTVTDQQMYNSIVIVSELTGVRFTGKQEVALYYMIGSLLHQVDYRIDTLVDNIADAINFKGNANNFIGFLKFLDNRYGGCILNKNDIVKYAKNFYGV